MIYKHVKYYLINQKLIKILTINNMSFFKKYEKQLKSQGSIFRRLIFRTNVVDIILFKYI